MRRGIVNHGYTLACDSTGSGPRIVWVDPALGSSSMRPMEEELSALAQRFEVVTYDRRGRGRNAPTSDVSPSAEIDDLRRVVSEVGSVRAVVGFSSGAALVLQAAAGLDVPLLVLVEPATSEVPDTSGLSESVRSSLEAGDPAGAVRTFYAVTRVPQDIVQDIVRSEAWPAVVRAAPTLLSDLDLTHVPDNVLTGITTPVHLIVSAGSPAEITEMSDRLADRLTATIWREPGGWHGIDALALQQRLDKLINSPGTETD